MTSHQFAIAKASFSAGLLRPDPKSISREDIAQFHALLNSAVLQCTPRNVQQCKQWMLGNIVQSTARFTALGKYLTALAASFAEVDEQKGRAAKREPSVKRKRLHLLYLLNDVLYHCKYRISDASICSKVQPMLVDLFGSAGSFKECPKHQAKLADLLDLWEEKAYYSKDYISKLRETVRNALEAGQHGASGISTQIDDGIPSKNAKSAPYVMPATHGDTSTPWFDLPAGNLMPHIVPNSTRPINPDLVKPLQFVAGPAEERLASAVKDLLEDVHLIFGDETELVDTGSLDIDELGQRIISDEITGEIIDGEGYYGWSKSFCEKMKRRKDGPDPSAQDYARLSRSSSRSSSPGGRKRLYSDGGSSSSEGLRRTRRRRSYSPSRSPSPDPGRRNGQSKPNSRGRSRSRSPRPSSRNPDYTARNFPLPQDNLPPRPQVPPMPQPPFHQAFNPNFVPPPPQTHDMPYNPQAQHFNQYAPPQQMQHLPFNPQQGPPFGQWPPPPPPPSGPPPPMNYQQQYQQQSQQQSQQQQPQYQQQQHQLGQQYGQYPPAASGGWQQGAGRGFNGGNPGWNNAHRGRGGYRGGRGW